MEAALIMYALDAIMAIITAQLKNKNDPAYQDLLTRTRAMVAERRDPTAEDEAALAAVLAAQRATLHS
jgi:hypothetical protein